MNGPVDTDKVQEPLLLFEDVSLVTSDSEYGSLESLGFVLHGGEVTAFLEMNRWERQALLDLITGLTPPDRGRILFKGSDPSQMKEDDLNVLRGSLGIVSDPPVYLNNVRIMENLRLPLRYHSRKKTPEIDARLEEIFRDLGVPSFSDAIPSRFNRGFLGLCSLVRALSTEPDLLVLERPTECLGEKNAYLLPKVYDKYVRSHGGAVLVLTDETRLAAPAIDRTGRFRKGRLCFDGAGEKQAEDDYKNNP